MKVNVTVELTLPQDGEKLAILAEMAGCRLAPTNTTIAAAPAAEAKIEKVEKPAKTEKAPKAEKAAKQPEAAAAGAPVAAGSEADKKSTEDVRAKAKLYVQRHANQTDGIAAFRALIKATCGVEKMDDLKHEQRLLVIAAVEKAVKELDQAKGPAKPAAASVEV